jgi:hypothetical protein
MRCPGAKRMRTRSNVRDTPLPPSLRFDQPRPAFVTAAGAVYRPSAQGGIRRCTALDLALMSGTATVACWRIGTVRHEG